MTRPTSLVKRLQAQYGPVVVALMGANLALQVLFGLIGYGTVLDLVYSDYLALSLENLLNLKLWTLLSYGFLHDSRDLFHVLFNMLALFFLGPQFERRWGSKEFLRFWILCIVGGGLTQALYQLVLWSPVDTVVGASGAIMGLVGAWSWVFPRQKLLLFFIIPIEARRIVPIAIVVDVVFALVGSDVAIAAHMGGLATAWLILNGLTNPRLLRTRWMHFMASHRARRRAEKMKKFRVIDGGKGDKDDDDDDPRWNIH